MEVDPECGDEQPSSDDCKGVQSSFALFPFFFCDLLALSQFLFMFCEGQL